ncbi:MAG: hypothetical protein QOD69_2898 [Solirubrobacteraceae bacterium]|nr:hypothetical protein [Solirubrobacteraceae bacterium]
MPREQPTRRSAVPRSEDPAKREQDVGLTPAQQHAMRRSAPLTPTQFTELRRLTEQEGNPLRRF